jgi:hypothetical protein
MRPPPDRNFDHYNTRQLRQLEADLAVAQKRQDAAQAVSDSLEARYATCRQAASAAQENAATTAANLAAARSTTQTVAHAVPLSEEAQDQAILIAAALEPVLEQAHAAALLLIDALVAIDALAAQVARSKGKNELISPLVISGVAQAQVDGESAMAAAAAALQNSMTALAAAQEASFAAGKVIDATKRLLALLAPAGDGFNPASAAGGGFWEGAVPPASMRDLGQAVTSQNASILGVLHSLSDIAIRAAAERQAAATQAALDFNAASDRLNRTSAAAAAAAASLAAAESAVA